MKQIFYRNSYGCRDTKTNALRTFSNIHRPTTLNNQQCEHTNPSIRKIRKLSPGAFRFTLLFWCSNLHTRIFLTLYFIKQVP
jgi:hypothetical protein